MILAWVQSIVMRVRRIGLPSRSYCIYALGGIALPAFVVWVRSYNSESVVVIIAALAYVVTLRIVAEQFDKST